jgi:hypothetical protein
MTEKKGDVVYVAVPYSHPDAAVVEERMRLFALTSSRIMAQGQFVFSPVLNHSILKHAKLPGDWQYWQHYCRAFLRRCDKLVVLRIPGWDQSTGVAEEIRFATENSMLIEYLDPLDTDLAAAAEDL